MRMILWEATSYGLAYDIATQARPSGFVLSAVTWSAPEQSYVADYVSLD